MRNSVLTSILLFSAYLLLLATCSTSRPAAGSGAPAETVAAPAAPTVEAPVAEAPEGAAAPSGSARGGSTSDKVALVIAIGEYDPATGWNNLSSNNDIPLIRYALVQQGFKEEDIVVLQDREASREGILKAVRTQLIDRAQPGGIAILHYSGHGQQIVDQNDDEIDLLDEALVPYDSPLEFKKGEYEGEKLIRDEEIGGLMNELRRKLGKSGNLLVILDSCHSGTGTRGEATARGTKVVMGDPNQLDAIRNRPPDNNSLATEDPAEAASLAPMVSFFGAGPNQLNFEAKTEDGEQAGSLSLAFSRVFSEADKTTTYRALFDRIKIEMSALAPSQTPQVEGQLDQEILGGRIVGQVNFFNVKQWLEPQVVKIPAGTLLGIFENTVFGFYPNGTVDPAEAVPLTTGKVVKVDETSCIVQLESEMEKEKALAAWAFIRERSYGDLKVQVKVDLTDSVLREALAAEMEKIPAIKPSREATLVVEQAGEDSVRLVSLANREYELGKWENTDDAQATAQSITKQLMRYTQGAFLRNLKAEDPEIALRLELLPVRPVGESFEFIDPKKNISEQGEYSFRVGDSFVMRVINDGNREAFFSIIDISPTNEILLLAPYEGSNEPANSYRVEARDTMLLRNFILSPEPPYGLETLKLIASREPLDLRSIVLSGGRPSRGNAGPLEQLFAATFYREENASRGLRVQTVPPRSANVHTVVFEIKP